MVLLIHLETVSENVAEKVNNGLVITVFVK